MTLLTGKGKSATASETNHHQLPEAVEFMYTYYSNLVNDPNIQFPKELEYHALWCYASVIGLLLEEREILYEGITDPSEPNYRQLMANYALIYGVTPQMMTKCWPVIDRAIKLQKLKPIPDLSRIRQNRIITL